MSHLFVQGNSLHALEAFEDHSFDACVTDPPYELGFMGKHWDKSGISYNPDLWRQVLRVLKPGAHLLAFGGTRTYHRMACAIEDAGFEIRDQIQWLYGSGFPKSLDLSKAIDRQGEGKYRRAYVQAVQEAGLVLPANSKWDWTVGEHSPGNKWWKIFCEWLPSLSEVDRERVNRIVIGKGFKPRPTFHTASIGSAAMPNVYDITAPTSDEAKQWDGWGTALKPANEPICLARKPLEKALSVAQNVIKWGTGAINVDASRIPVLDNEYERNCSGDRGHADNRKRASEFAMTAGSANSKGRWPANILHDGSDEVLGHFPATASGQPSGIKVGGQKNAYGHFEGGIAVTGFGDEGSAARFFYCAKASQSERNRNLHDLPAKEIGHNRFDKCADCGGTILQNPTRPSACKCESPNRANNAVKGNHHPTVKPVELMKYLSRLITPPNGRILDPFCGSGSTVIAALIERFQCVGIDIDAEYLQMANLRINELQVSLI